MQLAVIEFARHVAGMKEANSTEFDPQTAFPVISLMQEQKAVLIKGATMRLGAYPCVLEKGTQAFKDYGEKEISERHRHRYEFNNAFRDKLTAKGLTISGASPDGKLVEIVELKKHPRFVACQFHPEFKSRPMAPHPLFQHFIEGAIQFGSQKQWQSLKSPGELPLKKVESAKTSSSQS